MTKEDIDNLFQLMAIYFPGDRRLCDKVLKNAWLLVLEPYEPSEVKAALASHLRESKYFPCVQDVAGKCRKLPPPAPAVKERYVADRLDQKHIEHCRRYHTAMDMELQARGLPQMRDFNGSCIEWDRMVTQAGIDVAGIIERTWEECGQEA